METEQQLTSVKVDVDNWEEFRINAIKYKFSFNKLVNRVLHLYNINEEFRKKIHQYKIEK